MSSAIIMIIIIIITRVLIELARAKGETSQPLVGTVFTKRVVSKSPFLFKPQWPGAHPSLYLSIHPSIHPSSQPASQPVNQSKEHPKWHSEKSLFLLLISDDYLGIHVVLMEAIKVKVEWFFFFLFASSSVTSDFPWNCAGIKCLNTLETKKWVQP